MNSSMNFDMYIHSYNHHSDEDIKHFHYTHMHTVFLFLGADNFK